MQIFCSFSQCTVIKSAGTCCFCFAYACAFPCAVSIPCRLTCCFVGCGAGGFGLMHKVDHGKNIDGGAPPESEEMER